MAHRLKDIDGVRYVGDAQRGIVHDRHHEECEDCLVENLVQRGAAVGFRPDTLAQAFDEGYDYCDWCLDGSDPDAPPKRSESAPSRRTVLGMVA
ncbi:MAG: hypothetical protein GF405_10440 [Candidatus Eisenbacteria bacterium]|nr:hypothetical protein [Candidatus Eisenbacteria bacterium]